MECLAAYQINYQNQLQAMLLSSHPAASALHLPSSDHGAVHLPAFCVHNETLRVTRRSLAYRMTVAASSKPFDGRRDVGDFPACKGLPDLICVGVRTCLGAALSESHIDDQI